MWAVVSCGRSDWLFAFAALSLSGAVLLPIFFHLRRHLELEHLKQFYKLLGRKSGLVENAFESAAFKVFAVEGNSSNAGPRRMAEKLV